MADENMNAPAGTPPAGTEQPTNIPAAPVTPPVGDPPATEEPAGLTTPPEQPNILEDKVGEDGVVEYEPTGNAALDVSLTFFGSLGIAAADPAMVQATKGDFSLLEAKLATMGDKAQGWQQMVALAKQVHSESTKAAAEQAQKTDAAILAVVQSKENWSAIVAWAAKNADPAEKAEINRMIDAGPVQARAAATLLLEAYKKATGTAITPRDPAGNASGVSEVSGQPLNAREYATAVASLHRKLGSRMEGSAEYRALQRRLVR